MKKYYLHNGTNSLGPYDLADLKTKHLIRETPVWYEGLDDWMMACQIPELREIMSPLTPPPFKAPQELHTPVIPKPNRWAQIFCLVAIIASCILTIIVISNVNKAGEVPVMQIPQTYEQKLMTVGETERLAPARFLKVSGTHHRNFWGGKLSIKGVIQNKASITSYKEAMISVMLYDQNKKLLATEKYTIYDSLPPYAEVKFEMKIENPGPVAELKYNIVKAKAY